MKRERTIYELPKDGQHVKLKTKRYGEREARWDNMNYCFWYTDCTHPAQNAHCGLKDVETWVPNADVTGCRR